MLQKQDDSCDQWTVVKNGLDVSKTFLYFLETCMSYTYWCTLVTRHDTVYVITWNVKTYISHPLKCRMCQKWLKWCSDPPTTTTPKLNSTFLDLEKWLFICLKCVTTYCCCPKDQIQSNAYKCIFMLN